MKSQAVITALLLLKLSLAFPVQDAEDPVSFLVGRGSQPPYVSVPFSEVFQISIVIVDPEASPPPSSSREFYERWIGSSGNAFNDFELAIFGHKLSPSNLWSRSTDADHQWQKELIENLPQLDREIDSETAGWVDLRTWQFGR